ncbi:hypothetical protein CAC42_4228 [Sphaceloma murrayae]|uniref:Wax synthase domain-containing protein n=1 Tax=Sphaceloma murrayae TaxID=2082308 RepID=A0A2K1QKS9_9PEZI|nr:hypothetical protein CAC42_4228 [Sphaceloma murrayae]
MLLSLTNVKDTALTHSQSISDAMYHMDSLHELYDKLMATEPRPGLHPIPGSKPLTLEAMICPPMIYYLALLFLPPPPPEAIDTPAVKLLRNILAAFAGFLFFRLPLAYHVPQSIGLTYQLGLVGLYGGARVIDAFFLSPYLFRHIPRRVRYRHEPRVETPLLEGFRDATKPSAASKSSSSSALQANTNGSAANVTKRSSAHAPQAPSDASIHAKSSSSRSHGPSASNLLDNVYRRGSLPSLDESYFLLHRTISGPQPQPVTEHAISEDGWPHTFLDRASWALELELSMRGVGFTWTTADVRHTRKTWLPTVSNRLHSIFVHVVPILGACFVIIRTTYVRYLADVDEVVWTQHTADPFDTRLGLPLQLLLTGALGAFLMAAFSFAHSAFAIVCAPLAPSPLAYFPPLYTTRIWNVRSVRGFWSYGWHRLFARFFLVYGVWPGEWIERKIMGKGKEERADVGKVVGGFLSSAFCHSFAVRGVLGGEWQRARGEAIFFAVNGFAVVIEEAVNRVVMAQRRKKGGRLDRWYDGYLGRIWWISLLLFTGRNFARGWVNAGLVREMSAM